MEEEENDHEFLGPKRMIKKEELVRIIAGSLHEMGFVSSACELEKESNIHCKSPEFKNLESHIKNGEWEETLQLLSEIKDDGNQESMKRALNAILKQCLCEFVARKNYETALNFIIRDYYGLLGVKDEAVLEKGFGFLRGIEDSSDDEEIAIARAALVEELENLLPPEAVVPRNRLFEILIGLNNRWRCCTFHPVEGKSSFCECKEIMERLESHFRNGEWEESFQVLSGIKNDGNQESITKAIDVILRQSLRECMAQDDPAKALYFLMFDYDELLGVKEDDLLEEGTDFVRGAEGWSDEEIAIGRAALVEEIRDLLPPEIVFPRNRLQSLLYDHPLEGQSSED